MRLSVTQLVGIARDTSDAAAAAVRVETALALGARGTRRRVDLRASFESFATGDETFVGREIAVFTTAATTQLAITVELTTAVVDDGTALATELLA